MRIKKLVYETIKPSKTGGGFMNQYNIIVEQLLMYLAERKQCSSSRLSHKQCYEEFGQYLKENHLFFHKKQLTNGLHTFRRSITGKMLFLATVSQTIDCFSNYWIHTGYSFLSDPAIL